MMCTSSQAIHATQPGKPQPPEVGDRRGAADGRHVAVVAVPEGEPLAPFERAQDVARRVAPLLHRHLRHAGQQRAVLLEAGEIADDEHVGVSRDAEVRRAR